MKISVFLCVMTAVISTASSAFPQWAGEYRGIAQPGMRTADVQYMPPPLRAAEPGLEPQSKIRLIGPDEEFGTVAFSPDRKTLALANLDLKTLETKSSGCRIELWEAATGKSTARFPAAAGFVECLAFSPDGNVLASADADKIRLWEVATGKNLAQFQGASGPIHSLGLVAERMCAGDEPAARVVAKT